MIKVSRSIWKNTCNLAITLIFVAAMLVGCTVPVMASATYIPPNPINIANTTGELGVNYTWQAGSEWHLISSGDAGSFHGFNFNRTISMWQSDSMITSGLDGVMISSAPTVGKMVCGTLYLVRRMAAFTGLTGLIPCGRVIT
ncbi:MAG: hypothetical protein EF813_03930 [Methanosarcinales archaeon]|nr:MAG: hypothetical protein EF813_03930 [Methanosarcinales archaeon]